MKNFSPELLKALAYGDIQVHEQIKDLPINVRIALGTAIDQMRRDENIVPMSTGFSVYEKKNVTQEEHDALGKALAERIKREKDAMELKEKIRKEHLEIVARQQADRARAGLLRNDR